MSDIVMRVDDLTKRYRLGLVNSKTLHADVSRWWARLRGKPDPLLKVDHAHHIAKHGEYVWALDGVSFEVKRGEILGVIGKNGAGKSTLLKILTKITAPTSGTAKLKGRVGSLLEVGTGFHPELTGRENVFLNGAILGMRNAEVRGKVDEILAFAEVEAFADTPVKRFSSGMYVRLAFAVAAHLEPEILLVDEVLAVGDAAFQRKCLGKMRDVSSHGRTVLFVSHNMRSIRALCSRCILLHDGNLALDGDAPEVVEGYYRSLRDARFDQTTAVGNTRFRRGSGDVRFTSIDVGDVAGNSSYHVHMHDSVVFRFQYRVFKPVSTLSVYVQLQTTGMRQPVTSLRHRVPTESLEAGQSGTITVELPNVVLRPGEYGLYFWLGADEQTPYDVVDDLTAPLIVSTDLPPEQLGFDPSRSGGIFSIESRLVAHEVHTNTSMSARSAGSPEPTEGSTT